MTFGEIYTVKGFNAGGEPIATLSEKAEQAFPGIGKVFAGAEVKAREVGRLILENGSTRQVTNIIKDL